MAQLQEHQINMFNCDEVLPFAVVGSNVLVEDGEGRKVRGRKYPWGTVNIEDTEHSDFLSLRRLILCRHMLVKTPHPLCLNMAVLYLVISGPQTSHSQPSLRDLQARQAGFCHQEGSCLGSLSQQTGALSLVQI